jgi:hypothetical protein
MPSTSSILPVKLPPELADLFWEYDFSSLSWSDHRDFLALRILSHGCWEQIRWLRDVMPDDALRQLIIATRGKDLSPRQLRFWQLILELPDSEVDGWLSSPSRQIWDRRSR